MMVIPLANQYFPHNEQNSIPRGLAGWPVIYIVEQQNPKEKPEIGGRRGK
jgi:hypothetical protein